MFRTIEYRGGFIMISVVHNVERVYGLIYNEIPPLDDTLRSKDMTILGVKRWITKNMKKQEA
jgi:hypothetical protein